jgi:hypothetical protein
MFCRIRFKSVLDSSVISDQVELRSYHLSFIELITLTAVTIIRLRIKYAVRKG